ncbi:MAG TPA: hypothetical protein VHW25_17905 [Steroidobacteraceae bacterium]|jgi:hypothetical protein|nr:hypothetical protein [Steroidobacteraceae bacterium]
MSQAIATRHPVRHAVVRIGAVLALAVGIGTGAAQASDTAGVPALSVAAPAAHWVERKLDFTYMGFTDKFTCDGLRDTVREALLALGARKKDFTIQERGCTHLNGVEPSPAVAATFSVLVPLTPDDIGKVGNSASQPTQWHSVDLVRLTSAGVNSVPCELLEQLKNKALPLFTTRNLKYRSSCFPHQVSLGDIDFSVDVLRPAAAP